MKQVIAMFVLALILPISVSAETPEEKGLAIVRDADNRDTGFQDFTANMLMTLRNRHGQESIRKIRIRTLEVTGDGDKSLTIFDNPRDVKGTAFLNYFEEIVDNLKKFMSQCCMNESDTR